jgi:hypothetical protein
LAGWTIRPSLRSIRARKADSPRGRPVRSCRRSNSTSSAESASVRNARQSLTRSSRGLTRATPSSLPAIWAAALDHRHRHGARHNLARTGFNRGRTLVFAAPLCRLSSILPFLYVLAAERIVTGFRSRDKGPKVDGRSDHPHRCVRVVGSGALQAGERGGGSRRRTDLGSCGTSGLCGATTCRARGCVYSQYLSKIRWRYGGSIM